MEKQKKPIILHDTFLYKWWWERLMIMMQKALNCDIATWFVSKGSFDLKKEITDKKIYEFSSEIFSKWFRHIKLKIAFLFNSKILKNYDTVIFSWDCLSAVRNCKPWAKKIYYCHTPPRYLYDLRWEYIKKVKWYMRIPFEIISFVFKKMYESDIKKMDLILTNSINTQNRLKKFLWYDSKIIYPPVKLEEFTYLKEWDYYLSFARLSSAKRVDKIVKAFTKIPNKKLIVIYWKNDPQKEEIFELWRWYGNIEFVYFKDNIWFNECVWSCIATIYVPIDEDFWMSPIESMAAWKPVLWVNEGWLKESIIHKKTGYLIEKWAKIDDIIKALDYLTLEKCLNMKNDCEKRARDFSYENFEKQINKYANN